MKKEFADVLAWLFTLASLSGIKMADTISKYTSGCPVCHKIPCICEEKKEDIVS
jgi:NTP pyrophosphatase (non-canonical NTP hydrolase)